MESGLVEELKSEAPNLQKLELESFKKLPVYSSLFMLIIFFFFKEFSKVETIWY